MIHSNRPEENAKNNAQLTKKKIPKKIVFHGAKSLMCFIIQCSWFFLYPKS